MCIDLFRKLPHPEESPDFNQEADINLTLGKWGYLYHVPDIYDWNNAIVIKIESSLAYPAATWEENGKRHLAVRPEWLNPGVIAHEQAHNSYALLPPERKAEFDTLFQSGKVWKYPYASKVRKQKPYSTTSAIECHAELYRYIGEKLHKDLQQFYPYLF